MIPIGRTRAVFGSAMARVGGVGRCFDNHPAAARTVTRISPGYMEEGILTVTCCGERVAQAINELSALGASQVTANVRPQKPVQFRPAGSN